MKPGAHLAFCCKSMALFTALPPYQAIEVPHDIMPAMLPNLEIDDIVRLRKPHPCGGYEWKVFRLGADIGLECTRCGRRVMLPRRTLSRRLKTIVNRLEDE
jgi:hypothetical protein